MYKFFILLPIFWMTSVQAKAPITWHLHKASIEISRLRQRIDVIKNYHVELTEKTLLFTQQVEFLPIRSDFSAPPKSFSFRLDAFAEKDTIVELLKQLSTASIELEIPSEPVPVCAAMPPHDYEVKARNTMNINGVEVLGYTHCSDWKPGVVWSENTKEAAMELNSIVLEIFHNYIK